MQKKFKNQRALMGVVGLAMLGTGNAQAVSSLSKQPSVGPDVSNTVPVPDPVVLKSPAQYGSKGEIGVSNSPLTLPIKTVGQSSDVKSIEVGSLIGGSGIDVPLSAQAYRYGGFPNVGVDHGAVGQADNVTALVPSLFEALAKMPSVKMPANKIPEASPVPLPAAAWSFLIGLLGILGLKKRKGHSSENP
ncbi:MAG: hypothetical protein ACXWFF_14565 [Methylomonas sp.]